MTKKELVYILHLVAIGLAAGLKAVAEEVERPAVETRPRPRPRPREAAAWDDPQG